MASFGMRTLGVLVPMWACCFGCDEARAPVSPAVESTPDAASVETPDDPVMPGRPSPGCRGDSDCNGGACVRVTDGFSACSDLEAEFETTADAGELGACDGDHPCESGTCFRLGVAAGTSQCSPGGFDTRSLCISDECSSDVDCPNGGLCAPAGVSGTRLLGVFPRRRCMSATCRSNADCTLKPGGICGMIRDECTPYGVEQWGYRDARITCVYPDGCTRGSDCTSGYCDEYEGAAVCLSRAVGSAR